MDKLKPLRNDYTLPVRPVTVDVRPSASRPPAGISAKATAAEIAEAIKMAKQLHVHQPGIVFVPGFKLQVQETIDNQWYDCKLTEVDWGELDIRVHYQRWSDKYDEWLKMDSKRIRPASSDKTKEMNTFKVGDGVLAFWAPDQRKYYAKVTRVINPQHCEVLFQDNISKVLPCTKLTKYTGKIPVSPDFVLVSSDQSSTVPVVSGIARNASAASSATPANTPVEAPLTSSSSLALLPKSPVPPATAAPRKSFFDVEICEEKRKPKRKREFVELMDNIKRRKSVAEDGSKSSGRSSGRHSLPGTACPPPSNKTAIDTDSSGNSFDVQLTPQSRVNAAVSTKNNKANKAVTETISSPHSTSFVIDIATPDKTSVVSSDSGSVLESPETGSSNATLPLRVSPSSLDSDLEQKSIKFGLPVPVSKIAPAVQRVRVPPVISKKEKLSSLKPNNVNKPGLLLGLSTTRRAPMADECMLDWEKHPCNIIKEDKWPGWVKQFSRRLPYTGQDSWDTTYFAPDGRAIRNKRDLSAYAEEYTLPGLVASFDFSAGGVKEMMLLHMKTCSAVVQEPPLPSTLPLPKPEKKKTATTQTIPVVTKTYGTRARSLCAKASVTDITSASLQPTKPDFAARQETSVPAMSRALLQPSTGPVEAKRQDSSAADATVDDLDDEGHQSGVCSSDSESDDCEVVSPDGRTSSSNSKAVVHLHTSVDQSASHKVPPSALVEDKPSKKPGGPTRIKISIPILPVVDASLSAVLKETNKMPAVRKPFFPDTVLETPPRVTSSINSDSPLYIGTVPIQQQETPLHGSTTQDTSVKSPFHSKGTFLDSVHNDVEGIKCPVKNCHKTFRKESLLQMHVKHYHPCAKLRLGTAAPNVADLAYARTVGGNTMSSINSPSLTALPPKYYQERRNTRHSIGDLTDVKRRKMEKELAKDLIRRKSMPGHEVSFDNVAEDSEVVVEDVSQAEGSEGRKPQGITDSEGESDGDFVGFSATPLSRSLLAITAGPSPAPTSIAATDDTLQESVVDTSSAVVTPCPTPSETPAADLSNTESATTDAVEEDDGPSYDIVNCRCESMDEEGLMLQCDVCQCWQHAACYSIEPDDVPEHYVCAMCTNPAYVRSKHARDHLVSRWLKEAQLPRLVSSSKFEVPPKVVECVKRAHELRQNLFEQSQLLFALSRIMSMAQQPDHPKLVMFFKKWPDPRPSGCKRSPSLSELSWSTSAPSAFLANCELNLSHNFSDVAGSFHSETDGFSGGGSGFNGATGGFNSTGGFSAVTGGMLSAGFGLDSENHMSVDALGLSGDNPADITNSNNFSFPGGFQLTGGESGCLTNSYSQSSVDNGHLPHLNILEDIMKLDSLISSSNSSSHNNLNVSQNELKSATTTDSAGTLFNLETQGNINGSSSFKDSFSGHLEHQQSDSLCSDVQATVTISAENNDSFLISARMQCYQEESISTEQPFSDMQSVVESESKMSDKCGDEEISGGKSMEVKEVKEPSVKSKVNESGDSKIDSKYDDGKVVVSESSVSCITCSSHLSGSGTEAHPPISVDSSTTTPNKQDSSLNLVLSDDSEEEHNTFAQMKHSDAYADLGATEDSNVKMIQETSETDVAETRSLSSSELTGHVSQQGNVIEGSFPIKDTNTIEDIKPGTLDIETNIHSQTEGMNSEASNRKTCDVLIEDKVVTEMSPEFPVSASTTKFDSDPVESEDISDNGATDAVVNLQTQQPATSPKGVNQSMSSPAEESESQAQAGGATTIENQDTGEEVNRINSRSTVPEVTTGYSCSTTESSVLQVAGHAQDNAISGPALLNITQATSDATSVNVITSNTVVSENDEVNMVVPKSDGVAFVVSDALLSEPREVTSSVSDALMSGSSEQTVSAPCKGVIPPLEVFAAESTLSCSSLADSEAHFNGANQPVVNPFVSVTNHNLNSSSSSFVAGNVSLNDISAPVTAQVPEPSIAGAARGLSSLESGDNLDADLDASDLALDLHDLLTSNPTLEQLVMPGLTAGPSQDILPGSGEIAPSFPEAERIESSKCRYNLLCYVQAAQDTLEHAYDTIEAKIRELESELHLPELPEENGDDDAEVTVAGADEKQLMQMLLADMAVLQEIADGAG